MLAMDVSLSMGAKDVDPQPAHRRTARGQDVRQEYPADTRIGIVAFGATASLDAIADPESRGSHRGHRPFPACSAGPRHRQPPLRQPRDTLFPDAGIDLESLVFKGGLTRYAPAPAPGPKPAVEKKEFKPVSPASCTSAVIILLSDGRRTTGSDPPRRRENGGRCAA